MNEPGLPARRKVITMSSTISTHRPHHVPLLASLSIAGVIAAAGVVGVAWHESGTSDAHAPAQVSPLPGAFRNANVAERNLEQSGENANVAEHNLQQHAGQGVGRGDFQSPAGGGKTVGGP
jgi:hypothetical protein